MRAIESSAAAARRHAGRPWGRKPGRSRRQRVCLRARACAAAVAWLAGCGAPAAGTMAPDLVLARIPQISWQPPHEIRAFGLTMTWRGLRSSLDLPQAARALAGHTGLFEQIWIMPRRVVLAGTRGATHWVAELVAAGRGSAGVVSSMPLGAHDLRRALEARAGQRMDWMPPQAYLRASHESGRESGTEGGRRVRQQVYSAPWPPAELRAQVEERLRARGWLRAARGDIPRPARHEVLRAWQKNGQSLLLTFVPLAGGSAVYVRLDADP